MCELRLSEPQFPLNPRTNPPLKSLSSDVRIYQVKVDSLWFRENWFLLASRIYLLKHSHMLFISIPRVGNSTKCDFNHCSGGFSGNHSYAIRSGSVDPHPVIKFLSVSSPSSSL